VPPVDETVAENVTALPAEAGFGVAVSDVEVVAGVTDWATALLPLPE
jgi:hypothetical protein